MSIQMGRPRKLCRTQRTEFGLRERRNVAPVGAHLGHTPILGESTAGPGRVGSSAGRCKGGKRLRGDFLCRLRDADAQCEGIDDSAKIVDLASFSAEELDAARSSIREFTRGLILVNEDIPLCSMECWDDSRENRVVE